MPAISPTVWLPVFTSPAPVVPPSPTSARLGGRAVDLQVELARIGGRVQVLDDLERARVAGVGDRADDVVAVADGMLDVRACRSRELRRRRCRTAADRRGVVGRSVPVPGGLADRVGARC